MAKRKQSAKALTSKTCRQMTDLVLGYLTDKLTAGVKREFEQHLAVCPDCVSFLNTYKKTVAVTKSVQQTDLPASVRDNILTFLRKRIRRPGAVLLCIVTQLAI
jgi:Putative zinc-finger